MKRTKLQILQIKFSAYVMEVVSKIVTIFNAYAFSHNQFISYVEYRFEYGDKISLNTV